MKKFDELASEESIQKAQKALAERGFLPAVLSTGAEALARIKALIPEGASVMNGSSRTLEEIGFVKYLKEGDHDWNNLHKAIIGEKDPVKQSVLRKQSVVSDYYLGSAHAIAETGEIVIASNTGSQLPHLAFTSQNIILVVGTQKIASTLEEAVTRLKEYVLPLENDNLMEKYGRPSFISKMLILNKEQEFMGRKFHIIFVKEKLGF